MADLRPTEARQGRRGKPVLGILIVALALCVIVFIGLGFFNSSLPDSEVGSATVSTPADNAPSTGGLVAPDASNPAGGNAAPATRTQP